MKKANACIVLLISWLTISCQVNKPGLIPIDGSRWYQVNNTSNGLQQLFDGNTFRKVETGWDKILKNYEAYYPLEEGEEMIIDSVRMFDGEGTCENKPMTLGIITQDWQRKVFATFTGERYYSWVGPYVNDPDKFKLTAALRGAKYLVINTYGIFPTEIELYGTYKKGKKTKVASLNRPVILKNYLGVNAFEWNFEDAKTPWQIDENAIKPIKSFSGIRHYLDWEKLEATQGSYSFNPTINGGWNYDAIYERCKQEGIEVLACLKTIPKWLENTYPANERDYENIPAKYGADLSKPASYIEQARVAFQYIARYGSNKSLNPALVSVNTTPRWTGDNPNTKKIGLGLIQFIECDNERDKTWKGRKAYQNGREYAANLSAFYDGHKNTLGAGIGVKNADSTVKVVIGGLAGSSTDYLRAMIDWCKEFRGYKPDGKVDLCWDIINYHLYSNDAKQSQGKVSTRGAAPEISGTEEQATAFVKAAHDYCYDIPVWITEAGYDISQGSPLKAIAIGSKSVLETQADWILRTALMYARSGIQKVFFYQLTDDNGQLPVQFYSMGLVNNDKTRRPAADYIYQTKKLLGEYTYKETINVNPIVDRYELNGKPAFVLVVPDEKGITSNYTLNIGGYKSALIYKPKPGSDTMDVVKAHVVNNKINVIVTETPTFILPE